MQSFSTLFCDKMFSVLNFGEIKGAYSPKSNLLEANFNRAGKTNMWTRKREVRPRGRSTVSIHVKKKGQALAEMNALLDVSFPQPAQPLHDQPYAVVGLHVRVSPQR